MRDIAGERAGAVIPAFFLIRVRLQIAASRATISRDLIVRTVLRLYSAPKRILRFAWLPLRHNARCVIFVVENKPFFHFAVAFRTLIVRFHHLPRSQLSRRAAGSVECLQASKNSTNQRSRSDEEPFRQGLDFLRSQSALGRNHDRCPL